MIELSEFWYGKPHIFNQVLRPLAYLYLAGAWLRSLFFKPLQLPIPVISIGNIVGGGAGKTPTAIALAALLQSRYQVHFVTRGYGGYVRGPLLVDKTKHTYQQVGDEALLLAQQAPTWVSHDRYAGGMAAYQAGASLVILDDGLQQLYLKRTISFLVVDNEQRFGNGFVHPAGPLREPLDWGLKKTDAIMMTGNDLEYSFSKPTFFIKKRYAHYLDSNQPLLAFAGLGYPQKFFNALKELGFFLKERIAFPDHHPYSVKDIELLVKKASEKQAVLMTTAKDYLRIPTSLKPLVNVLEMSFEFDKSASLISYIEEKLKGHKG